jgi:hypothetical protein
VQANTYRTTASFDPPNHLSRGHQQHPSFPLFFCIFDDDFAKLLANASTYIYKDKKVSW